jgi:uncharacterized membrane protein
MWVIPAVSYNLWPITRTRRESGQVLATTAAAMVLLIAIAGMAAEVGLLWTQRRHMEIAADAAATEAAIALRNGESAARSSADNVASLNGFTNGADNTTVTVKNPPSAGPHAGNSDYVEVIVVQRQPVFFLRVLGYHWVDIGARAVGGAFDGVARASGVSDGLRLTGSR